MQGEGAHFFLALYEERLTVSDFESLWCILVAISQHYYDLSNITEYFVPSDLSLKDVKLCFSVLQDH